MDLRDYLLRLQSDATAALALVPAAPAPVPVPPVVVTPGPTGGAPSTYPYLRSDRAALIPQTLPKPSVGGSVVDSVFVVDVAKPPTAWRVTDAAMPGAPFGTLSAPNMCQVSADDRMFFAQGENGTVDFYDYDPALTGVPFKRRGPGPLFLTEPTFSRGRPGVLYVPHYGYLVTEYEVATGKRTTLLDVQTDVGPLTQDKNQYMSACYSSRSEWVACAYGGIQETHHYITAFEASNPANRVTLDIAGSLMKVAGGPWQTLLNFDETPANLSASWAAAVAAKKVTGALGIHSISIDQSGTWLRIDIKGNGFFCFFNLTTRRVHQWPQAGADYTFFGHYCWGDRQLVRGICGPGDLGQYQWILTDFGSPSLQTPPTYRKLITSPPKNDQRYEDHSNWNHYRMDGVLVPVLSGTQRGVGQTAPVKYLDDELGLIATAIGAPQEHYRIGHHRCVYLTGEFHSSPRPQAFHSGRAALVTSNWGDPNGPRDLYLWQF